MHVLYIVMAVMAYLWIGVLRSKIAMRAWRAFEANPEVPASATMSFLFPLAAHYRPRNEPDKPFVHQFEEGQGLYSLLNALIWPIPMAWSILFYTVKTVIRVLSWSMIWAVDRHDADKPKVRVEPSVVESKQLKLERLRSEYAANERANAEKLNEIHNLEAELEIGAGNVHRALSAMASEESS